MIREHALVKPSHAKTIYERRFGNHASDPIVWAITLKTANTPKRPQSTRAGGGWTLDTRRGGSQLRSSILSAAGLRLSR